MSLLDRAIARQFLTNIVLLFVILFSFVVVIDVSLNIDQFLNLASRIGAREGSGEPGVVRRSALAALLIVDLWWPKLLQLYNFLLGLVMVGAMGFTLTQMSRNRELIAIMAGGISLGRLLRPVLIVALGLIALQAINQELVIPRIAPLLVRDHQDAGDHRLAVAEVRLTRDGQGRLLRAASFDANTGRLEGVYILERDAEGHAARSITADAASYDDGVWTLENGLARDRSGGRVGDPVPVDSIASPLDPNELRINRYESYAQALSFSQARRMLERPTLTDPEKRARYERICWGRFSMMASSVLSLVIAFPFYATREPRHPLVQSVKCAPVAMLALIGGAIGASASIPGLPPRLGVFIPVMILSVVGVAQISALKT